MEIKRLRGKNRDRSFHSQGIREEAAYINTLRVMTSRNSEHNDQRKSRKGNNKDGNVAIDLTNITYQLNQQAYRNHCVASALRSLDLVYLCHDLSSSHAGHILLGRPRAALLVFELLDRSGVRLSAFFC